MPYVLLGRERPPESGVKALMRRELKRSEDAPAEAFRLSDVPNVAVVVERAVGSKCARSWKILPTVGEDREYPDVSPRDAQALREWDALPRAAE